MRKREFMIEGDTIHTRTSDETGIIAGGQMTVYDSKWRDIEELYQFLDQFKDYAKKQNTKEVDNREE